MRALQLVVALLCLCAGFSGRAFAADPAATDAPLDAAQLAAIIDEANERRTLGDNSSAPTGPPWRTLTREKLTQLLHSPQFAQIGYGPHGELLDQAFAWDLVHFDSAGDIKRFFAAVNGPEYFRAPPPDADSVDGSRIGFYADATASAEGGAASALFNCLPWETWVILADDPLLWSMQRGESVDVPNTDDFGQCVRRQREDSSFANPTDPSSARGARSAAIIEDRLARQLLAHGCAGSGPDSCLVGLRALVSLSPQRPDLVAIVRRVAAEVAATQLVPVEPDDTATRTDAVAKARYDQAGALLSRRGIVLSAELELMRARPRDWTPPEVDTAIDAAIAQMLAWRRLDWSINPAGLHNRREYAFAMPWLHLRFGDLLPAATEARIRKLGREAAGESGCGLARLAREGQPPEFWIAYATAKLQQDGKDCNALPLAWIAERYLQASRAGIEPPLADIAERVQGAGEIHDRVDAAIANYCPASDWGKDPWGICTRHAALVAAELESERARVAEEEAQARAVAADPCREELVEAVEHRLGYRDEQGEAIASLQVACKSLPDAPTTAAIAILHLAHPMQDGDELDGDYDLDLLVADANGHVLAQVREANAATSDAVRLEGVGIDTGRYHLAPGVRAFGVTTENAPHCYACVYSESTLRLYVRDGTRLRRVFDGPGPAGSTSEDDDGKCAGKAATETRTLALGRERHAGYADLVMTTTTAHEPGSNQDSGEECAGGEPGTQQRETWIYDGKQYHPEPAAAPNP